MGIYLNRLPKMIELIKHAIINDIVEINVIMDYINVYGFTEYIHTICTCIENEANKMNLSNVESKCA